MTPRIRRRLLAGLIGALASIAGVSTLAFAATSSLSTSVSSTAEDAPPLAVEDYTYPGAAQILTAEGILLKKGDGRILLTECDFSADQIRVSTVKDPSVGRKDSYCFKAIATTGYLTLELPRVFALEAAADHSISADLTADGETTTVDVPKGDFVTVGEGNLPSGSKRSVLVEIRVTG